MKLLIEMTSSPMPFLAASTIAALFVVHALWRRSDGFRHPAAMLPILTAASFLGGFAVLSVIHNRTGESLPLLFGSETSDIGLSEYGVVICLLGAMIAFANLTRRGPVSDRLAFAFCSFACLFIAGEEISWGQWFFFWETPEPLAAVNLQSETNIHNLVNPRIYDVIYSAVGFATLTLAGTAYLFFGHTRHRGALVPVGLMHRVGAWLRGSEFGLILTLSAAVLLQHELFEEYSEFVFALAVALFLVQLSGRPVQLRTGSLERPYA